MDDEKLHQRMVKLFAAQMTEIKQTGKISHKTDEETKAVAKELFKPVEDEKGIVTDSMKKKLAEFNKLFEEEQ